MELVMPVPPLNLYDSSWPFWTYQAQLPSAKFVFNEKGRCGSAVDSMVSAGCIVSGAQVRRSVLFSRVHLHSYSTIEESVLLPEVDIGRNCRIRKAIIDRGVNIPEGTVIGEDAEQDKAQGFRVTNSGLVLVTRGMMGQREGYA